MDTFYTACPLVRRTQEPFVEWANIGGERRRFEFIREIFWLQQSESQLLYRHGGKVIKEGATRNDFYGYLSSCDIHEPTPEEMAAFYAITPESSIELVVQTTVFLEPACQTPETIEYNRTRPSTRKWQYAYLPNDWRQEISRDGERCWPRLERVELGSGVTWSSKNSPEDNALLKRMFKLNWKVEEEVVAYAT